MKAIIRFTQDRFNEVQLYINVGQNIRLSGELGFENMSEALVTVEVFL